MIQQYIINIAVMIPVMALVALLVDRVLPKSNRIMMSFRENDFKGRRWGLIEPIWMAALVLLWMHWRHSKDYPFTLYEDVSFGLFIQTIYLFIAYIGIRRRH